MTLPAWSRTLLLLTVTFAAGAMAGVGFDRHVRVVRVSGMPDARLVMHHLEAELELDSTQRAAIEAILARHQIAIDASWRVMQPQVRATLDSAHQEIIGVLRPDQAAKLRGTMMKLHGDMLR